MIPPASSSSARALGEKSIPSLRCRIVAGAANNQVATPEDADRLKDADVLYAPDFVINAGGVLHVVALEMERCGSVAS